MGAVRQEAPGGRSCWTQEAPAPDAPAHRALAPRSPTCRVGTAFVGALPVGRRGCRRIVPFGANALEPHRHKGVAMRIEYLQEFVHFSKSLNITQAAQELFTTQSTLSKHLRQIERELGAQLVVTEPKKMRLTPAGSLFASKARAIVNLYEETARQCVELSKREMVVMKAQYTSYQDTAAMRYLAFTQRLKADAPHAAVKYARASHRDFKEAIKRGSIDVALEYHCGDVNDIVAAYREQGLRAHHLFSDDLGIWCPTALLPPHATADMETLKGLTFMMPSDTSSPVYSIMSDLENLFGFTAEIRITGTDSQLEFIYSHDETTAYAWPLSFLDAAIFREEDAMATLPVEGTEGLVHSFAVALERHPDDQKEALLKLAFGK